MPVGKKTQVAAASELALWWMKWVFSKFRMLLPCTQDPCQKDGKVQAEKVTYMGRPATRMCTFEIAKVQLPHGWASKSQSCFVSAENRAGLI